MSMTFSHLICCLGYVHKGWSISSHLLTCVTALTSCGLSAATLEPLLSPRNKAAREILLKSRGIISLFDKLSTNSLAHSKEKLKSCQWSVLVWITNYSLESFKNWVSNYCSPAFHIIHSPMH